MLYNQKYKNKIKNKNTTLVFYLIYINQHDKKIENK
jgi:hypothetical protein